MECVAVAVAVAVVDDDKRAACMRNVATSDAAKCAAEIPVMYTGIPRHVSGIMAASPVACGNPGGHVGTQEGYHTCMPTLR